MNIQLLVVTGQGNEAIAVQAIKAGAQDYLVSRNLSSGLGDSKI